MSRSKLATGIIVGAAVGGLISLCDRDTRNQFVGGMKKAGSGTSYYMKNPSEAVHNLRDRYENIAGNLSQGAESALQIMNQVQDTLEKVSSLDDDQQQ
ncbi:hypothetical protein [Sediminibacillus albus]|uniref:Gas vesicle protein n=1 Tax=Sediminibacillus albus TaxID=407036 RepID=A0A1G9B853_9BACI|nr:hypothetical protein [Sediminibacillus albus]SDK35200.1 hypothetical protein SAMN05216243_2843 [Sediminibacillus albus]